MPRASGIATATGRKRATRARPDEPQAILALRHALDRGDEWLDALLAAIASWEAPEEVVRGRRYQYLIGGEAFDWLLLAERLLEPLDGAVPAAEREALLFHGRLPRSMDDTDFRRAIGDAKHRAHLNFLYGVAVEEALQLTVEEEMLKERRSCVWRELEDLDDQVFQRIYGRSQRDLLAAYREERALPPGDELSYGDLRAFTYWLSKYRMNQNDPARVASDTRKALVQVAALEAAAHRRAQQHVPAGVAADVVEGEVVARR
jgi:hypothetical protein